MNKKSYILTAIALVLAGVYVFCFTDWFRAKPIQIFDTKRPARLVGRNGTAADRVIFGLPDYYSLTEIKVVPLAALQTNRLAQPVWHLVSDEGSDDVREFFYGQKINGMDPAVEGSHPEPLQPGVMYRLFVAAGKIRGQHDFHLGAPPPSPPKPKNPDD